ncbi:MAG: hypothetical protein ACE15B_20050 [Bryobacteraceae bacterium]
MKRAALYFLAAGTLLAQGTPTYYVPQVVEGGSWKTIFTIVNLAFTTGRGTIRFFSESGQPLPLPVVGQTGSPVSEVTVDVAPRGVATLETAGRPGVDTLVAWADFQYDVSAPLVISCVVKQQAAGRPDYEAAVPVRPVGSRVHLIPFDNRAQYATGVAVMNGSSTASIGVPVLIRDETGQPIYAGSMSLLPRNHRAFVLAQEFPATRGMRGTIEFNPQSEGWFAAIGLRFNPTGPFTTVDPITP